jgi:acyl-CoA synthetase (AMP-forming)/AMP-acid ligase II
LSFLKFHIAHIKTSEPKDRAIALLLLQSNQALAFLFNMAILKDNGRRLVISVVDEMARDEPERIVYSIANSQDISKGLHDITASQLANAVNRTAWWLESELGKGSQFPTVGYFGPRMLPEEADIRPVYTNIKLDNDFRYVLLIFGCIKAGYKVSISPSLCKPFQNSGSVMVTSVGAFAVPA